jgi:hypothetical protein
MVIFPIVPEALNSSLSTTAAVKTKVTSWRPRILFTCLGGLWGAAQSVAVDPLACKSIIDVNGHAVRHLVEGEHTHVIVEEACMRMMAEEGCMGMIAEQEYMRVIAEEECMPMIAGRLPLNKRIHQNPVTYCIAYLV